MSTSSTSAKPAAAGGSDTYSSGKSVDWSKYIPGEKQDRTNALTPEENVGVWKKMYALAGVRGDEEKYGLRAAVYIYGAVNGTSGVGSYSGKLRTHFGGDNIPASIIPRACGVTDIRKFFRANMGEAYDVLSTEGMLDKEEEYLAKMSALGIAARDAFAGADYLKDCSKFTPTQLAAHNTAFKDGIARSTAARGGRSVDTIREQERAATIKAGAASEADGRPIEF